MRARCMRTSSHSAWPVPDEPRAFDDSIAFGKLESAFLKVAHHRLFAQMLGAEVGCVGRASDFLHENFARLYSSLDPEKWGVQVPDPADTPSRGDSFASRAIGLYADTHS